LKVDHGWQKQNLSEVENLFYHHSRQPKPVRTKSPLPQPDPSTYLYEPPAIPQLMNERQKDRDIQSTPETNYASIPSEATLEHTPARRKDGQDTPGTPQVHNSSTREAPSDGEANAADGDIPQGTPSGFPSYMTRRPVTPPLSPAGRNSQPAMPQTPVSLPPSTPLGKAFSPNMGSGSTAPISNPVASPAGGMKMNYEMFWSKINNSTPIAYKSSLSSTQVPTPSGVPLKAVAEAVSPGKQ